MARADWRRPSSFKGLEEGEHRIRLFISYDGTSFSGWQRQDGERTVQEEIERTLGGILGEAITVFGSGRTDSGVHALRQAAHFDTFSNIAPDKFRIILNTHLPKTIRILSSDEVGPDFHARFSTESREYWYLIKKMEDMLPFDDGRITPVRRFYPLERMNALSSILEGTHDFTTFSSARDKSLSKMRDIYVSRWDESEDIYGYPVLRYRVAGNAFLYHQVRSMVGTMLSFLSKDMDEHLFSEILESRDRSLVHKTAPSDGLYLADVSYDRTKYEWFEREHGSAAGTER